MVESLGKLDGTPIELVLGIGFCKHGHSFFMLLGVDAIASSIVTIVLLRQRAVCLIYLPGNICFGEKQCHDMQ